MADKLRIAVWHNLPSGGGMRALHDHLQGLAARGHSLEIWCPASADREYLPLKEFGTEHVLPWNEPDPQFLFLASARRDAAILRERMKQITEHCRQVAEEIHAGKFDVAFINTCRFFHAAPLGKYLSIPKVLYLQEPNRTLYEALPEPPFWPPDPPGRSRFAPWFLRNRWRDKLLSGARREQIRFEVEAAVAVDHILVNSHYSRESVLRAYGLDARVCYLGIESSRFEHSVPRGNFLLGLGAVVPTKNLEFAIRAVGVLKEPRPKLIWIGNAVHKPYMQLMSELATNQNIDLEIKMNLSERELVSHLAAATALICAPRLEPFGYAALEANAAGTPVIAVAEGGLRETIQHDVNGLIVDSQPAAMAAAIERLRIDPALARRLSETGRAQVKEKWPLAAAIDRLENHLREVAWR